LEKFLKKTGSLLCSHSSSAPKGARLSARTSVIVSVLGDKVRTCKFCIVWDLFYTIRFERLGALGHIDAVDFSEDVVCPMLSGCRQGDGFDSGLKLQTSNFLPLLLQSAESFDTGEDSVLKALFGLSGKNLEGSIFERAVFELDLYDFGLGVSVCYFLA
jgi:hypothetical protein